MKKVIALLLVLALILVGVVACRSNDPTPTPTPTPSQPASPAVSDPPATTPQPTNSPEPTPTSSVEPTAPVEKEAVRFAVISGPTGMGAAKLLSDGEAGLTLNRYEHRIAADNNELVAGLTSGEIDIATVASNVALNLYNKTGGKVKIIALGTQGVLHILEGGGGSTVNSMEDLVGETIYTTGQGANPEYILRYLIQESGMDPDNDVEIVFADPAEIQVKLLSGEIKYAMLPVPAATAAIIKGAGQVRAAIDVTETWNQLNTGSQLIMTAVVARSEFIESHPQAVGNFLQEYKASIEFVNGNVDAAAELIAGYGITPNAAIAKKAIPQCHLVYIDGKDMAPAISDYFMTLYAMNPAAVGGALPDDAIYYAP